MRNSEIGSLVKDLWRLSEKNVYVPLCIWGEAGVGKSESVKQAAEELQIDLVDLRLGNLEAPDLMGLMRDETVYPCVFDIEEGVASPARVVERFTASGLWHHVRMHHGAQIPERLRTDPLGFVEWNRDRLTKMGYSSLFETRTVYSAPAWFPAPDTSGILFLDEMNRAQRETKQGVFQLVLDHRIHELELPPRWIVVSANNPPNMTTAQGTLKYDVDEEEDKAFLSRFCHVVLDPSSIEWADYARRVGIEPTIRTLLSPSMVAGQIVERNLARKLLGMKGVPLPKIEPTPRSWTMLGRLLSDSDPPLTGPILRAVTEGLVDHGWTTDPDTNKDVQIPVAGPFLSFLEGTAGLGSDLRRRKELSPEEIYVAIERAVDLVRTADPDAEEFVRTLRKLLPEGEGGMLERALADVTTSLEPRATSYEP